MPASNYNWVCFDCRFVTRLSKTSRRLPKCAECGSDCYCLGYKVEIPQFSREVTGDVAMLPKFPYRGATFTVKGSAYFHDFGKFLADFENAFPYIRVQNLQLSPMAAPATATGEIKMTEELSFRMELVTLINPLN